MYMKGEKMKELKEKEALLTNKSMPKKHEGEEPKEKIERNSKVERKKEVKPELRGKIRVELEVGVLEEQIDLMIRLCTNKKELLKLKRELIDLYNHSVLTMKRRENNEEDGKIKRR